MDRLAETLIAQLKKALRSSWVVLLTLFMSATELSAQPDQDFLNQVDDLKWRNLDSAASLMRHGYQQARKDKDLSTSAHLALELSKMYNRDRNADSIRKWYVIAERVYDQQNDNRGKALAQFQEAYWHFCAGDYEHALNQTLSAMGQLEKLGDTQGIAEGHLLSATIFHFTNKWRESSVEGQLAGQKFELTEDYVNAAMAWSFAGHAYRTLGEIENAAHCFEKTLVVAIKTKNPVVMGMTYRDLAFFHSKLANYDSSEFYFKKALERIPSYMERQLMVTRNGMALNFLNSGKYLECIDLSMKVLKTVRQRNELYFLSEIPGYLAVCYEHLGQYDSAYKYMKMKSIFVDSLFTDGQEKALQEMRIKYETEKKEEQLASQEKNNLFIIALCLVLVILLGVLFLYYTKRQEKNKQLTQLNRELDQKNQQNELLLKEIHHRVKNNLEMVKSLISLQSAQLEDGKTRDAMIASQNRVQSMGIIHQKLYQGDNLGSIEMKDYFLNLGEGILDSFNAEDKVQIECVMDDLELDIDTAVPLGLIVNELLTNAIKYAFPKIDGVVQVSLKKEENSLLLNVSDNGIGKSIEQPAQGTGFGSQLIQLLTVQLNGEMKEEVDQGTHTSFRFKLDTAA